MTWDVSTTGRNINNTGTIGIRRQDAGRINSRPNLVENEGSVLHRGIGPSSLGGHMVQPLPSNTAAADQQHGDLGGDRGNAAVRSTLRKAVRKLVERIAIMSLDMFKAHISQLSRNEQ
jgi:hypothetical protein